MFWPPPTPKILEQPVWMVDNRRRGEDALLREKALHLASSHRPGVPFDDLIREAEKIYDFLTEPRPLSDKHAIPDGE